ncbi:MAG: DNA-processing protein DprA [Trueperaceae bacterium]|nr:DNA-processing protein DprA [Trueperaceae bacterium]
MGHPPFVGPPDGVSTQSPETDAAPGPPPPHVAPSALAPEVRAFLRLFANDAGPGPRALARLLDRYATPTAAHDAVVRGDVPHDLADVAAAVRPALTPATYADAARAFARQAAAGDVLVALGEATYPPSLAAIHDPPPLLWRRGHLPDALLAPAGLAPAVAIIGTRRASRDGLAFARALAYDVASTGTTVVSGLALGIDGAAHEGALAAAPDGTVAVLPTHLGAIHPPQHATLARRIARGGALLSDVPRPRRTRKHAFVRRNRIVSGLTRAVVVVEAPFRSGTRHTVDFAMEQGRDVFVVPHAATCEAGRAAAAWLRDGARPLVDAADLFDGS